MSILVALSIILYIVNNLWVQDITQSKILSTIMWTLTAIIMLRGFITPGFTWRVNKSKEETTSDSNKRDYMYLFVLVLYLLFALEIWI